MAHSLIDFDAKLSSVYKSALESGDLIFTASETIKSPETEYDVNCEICYAPALANKPHGVLPVVETDPKSKKLAPVSASAPASSDLHTTLSTPVRKAVQMTNPFLPHSPALYVADASEEHKILLNKFCIVPRHFLVITKGEAKALTD